MSEYFVDVYLEIDDSELSEDTKVRLARKVDRLTPGEVYRLNAVIADYYTLVFDSGEFYGSSEEEKEAAIKKFVFSSVENFYSFF